MNWRTLLGPILFKEFAVQLRGSRAALLITLYVGLVLVGARLLYGSVAGQLDRGAPLLSAQIGQVIFIGISLTLQALTVFLAPATTVNAISQEHERGTFELMLSAPVSATQVLFGKFIAALAFLLLLQLTTLPVFGLVVLFGGVSFGDIGQVLFTLLATSVVGCMLGLCCSALTRQTYSATLLCYAILISLVGGSLFLANAWSLVNGLLASPVAILAANPLSAMASSLAAVRPPEASLTGGLRPLALVSLLASGVTTPTGERVFLPLYRVAALVYGAMSLLLFWVALHAVRPRRRWELRREDAVMLAMLATYGLLGWLARNWWSLRIPGA